MPSHSCMPHLLCWGSVVQPACQRKPELLYQQPGLQTWPFPNTQGVLTYFLFLISALPHSTHQQLCNLNFILLFWTSGTCGRKVGILENYGVTNFRIVQLHPRAWSLDSLSINARTIMKSLAVFTYQFLSLNSVLYCIYGQLPLFHSL